MTLDELADALFPQDHDLSTDTSGVTAGNAVTAAGRPVGIVGISDGKPVGIEAATALSAHVLRHVSQGQGRPLLILVDTKSQKMARRDELLGLNEYLAHLCKCLALASFSGHRTIGVIYGAAAAGAFIATALATEMLIAVPGAEPSVMDLPSIARVTKLPLDKLKDMAKTTPIFAPGLVPLAATGAVSEMWDGDRASYADRLDGILSAERQSGDSRDVLGQERQGRRIAADVARKVMAEAAAIR